MILRYAFHLYDMRQGENSSSPVWEKRGPLAYYAELIFELAVLLLDFVHHLHMLLWSNIFLSMASLVICMQLRYLFHEIQRRIKKHRNYLWVLNHMEQKYIFFFFCYVRKENVMVRISVSFQLPDGHARRTLEPHR